jgi:cytochrome P450
MNLFTPETLHNPYPAYQAMRAAGPLHWCPEFCGGAWVVLNYDDVAEILRDPRFSVQRAGGWVNSSGLGAAEELREFKRIFARSLIFMNPPRHTRMRHGMNGGFKPTAIQAFAPRIQAIVDRLIDRIIEEGLDLHGPGGRHTFDFMREFARPLPAQVIAGMMAVEANAQTDFVGWSDDIAAFIGSPTPTLDIARRAQCALLAMHDYFRIVVPERRARPGEDLVSQLIAAEADGQIVTEKSLLAQCCTLLFAGHETTRNLLGNGVNALLSHPDQWALLQRQPELMRSAVRELLRFDSSVQYTGRRTRTDVNLHGQTLKKGDLVIALIGAANHDPDKFTAPERLDVTRNEGHHLSFGFGPHVCIGASLTYLEADIALRRVMERLPQLQRVPGEPAWSGNSVYRGLLELPLTFTLPAGRDQKESHALECHSVLS